MCVSYANDGCQTDIPIAPSPMKPHEASREPDCENDRTEDLKLPAPKALRRRAKLHNDTLIFASK